MKDLKKIEVIDISSNKIKDASFIFDLPVLKYADISSNEIDITAYQWKKLTENGLNLKL